MQALPKTTHYFWRHFVKLTSEERRPVTPVAFHLYSPRKVSWNTTCLWKNENKYYITPLQKHHVSAKKGNPSNTFPHISLCGKDRVVWIDEVGNVTAILVKPSMWRLDIWLKETTFRNVWNVWHFVEMIFVEEERSPQVSSFLQASESAESWKHKNLKNRPLSPPRHVVDELVVAV